MKKQMTREEKEQTVEQPIVAYKGFDKNMQCRCFQYEVGKTYEHEGRVMVCDAGFHSCEYPFDVFRYYEPSSSRFAVVHASGQISRETDGDTKIASASIAVKAEISLTNMTARAVDWIVSKLDRSIKQTVTTGDCSAATNTGSRSDAEVTGTDSVAASLGIKGRARASAGGAIVLCYRGQDNGALIHIRASKVGENAIKPDTWYVLNEHGEFVEDCDEQAA